MSEVPVIDVSGLTSADPADRPVAVAAPSTWHRLRKFVRRNRWLILAIIGLALTGTFLTAKYVAQRMLAQSSGSIILTATTDALIGQAGIDDSLVIGDTLRFYTFTFSFLLFFL